MRPASATAVAIVESLEERSFLCGAAADALDAPAAPATTAVVMGPRVAKAGTPVGCPSPYQGVYIGQFNIKYKDYSDPERPVTRNKSFRLTITLRCMSGRAPAAVLRVIKAQSNDPFFGATRAVTPRAASSAVLPVPTRNISNRAGQGLVILFPNGAVLSTSNGKGQLHTSTDGRTISNAVGVKNSWVVTRPGSQFIQPLHVVLSATWSMTKSAL